MSIKYDVYPLCTCEAHSYYEWEKEANKCIQCAKPLYDDAPILKAYTFIHPLTGAEQEIYCEILTEDGIVGKDSYYQCLVEGEVIAQFPKSYAMMRTD